jgi:hypothetical protein
LGPGHLAGTPGRRSRQTNFTSASCECLRCLFRAGTPAARSDGYARGSARGWWSAPADKRNRGPTAFLAGSMVHTLMHKFVTHDLFAPCGRARRAGDPRARWRIGQLVTSPSAPLRSPAPVRRAQQYSDAVHSDHSKVHWINQHLAAKGVPPSVPCCAGS